MNTMDKDKSVTPVEAFRNKDIEATKAIHSEEAIKHRIIHVEKHKSQFTLPEIILGGQDGLVNVLGVILGVAAATSSSQIVLVAGLAATFAESISMAAVAYTSKVAEADYYQAEFEREKWEIEHHPEGEKQEIRTLYERYGFRGEILNQIVETITADESNWLKVMMEQELKLEPIERKQAIPAAIIVGFSALVGSFVPLTAFFFLSVRTAVITSVIISSVTLFVVGYYKAQKTLGRQFVKQGLEIMIIGMVSAFVGYLVGVIFKVPGGT